MTGWCPFSADYSIPEHYVKLNFKEPQSPEIRSFHNFDQEDFFFFCYERLPPI